MKLDPQPDAIDAILAYLDRSTAPPPTANDLQGWYVLTANGTDRIGPYGPKPIRRREQ